MAASTSLTDGWDSCDKPPSNVSVHGVFTNVSPIKRGKSSSFWYGTLMNGQKKLEL